MYEQEIYIQRVVVGYAETITARVNKNKCLLTFIDLNRNSNFKHLTENH